MKMSVDLWTHQTIAGNGDAAQPVAFEDSEDAFLYKFRGHSESSMHNRVAYYYAPQNFACLKVLENV